jgi:hypothetical protein
MFKNINNHTKNDKIKYSKSILMQKSSLEPMESYSDVVDADSWTVHYMAYIKVRKM